MTDALLILAGILLLYLGGEALVRGACSLARHFGWSSLAIGLTVVSFGTSSPELAATLTAAFQEAPEVAFGNVVGSNTANLALILGLTALLWPIATTVSFIKREVTMMVLASALLCLAVLDHAVGRTEGVILFALLIGFLVYLFRREREGEGGEAPADRGPVHRWWLDVLLVALGVLLLTGGAKALVAGAVAIAGRLGVGERVIGLTMVALGTSLPELAASVVAAARREGDIVLGNIIGSNIFNILCILGLTSIVHPIAIAPHGLWIDLGVMMAVSVLLWPLLASRLRVDRWEGALLLATYVGYVVYLFGR